MSRLSDRDAIEYLRRCYTAVDGLWFMKVEEYDGFDAALDIDIEVWKVMPKIQARTLKSKLNQHSGIESLRICFEEKLEQDGFFYTTVPNDHGFSIYVQDCPWHNALKKAVREHLSGTIGKRICTAEFSVWAAEFGEHITCSFHERLCEGSESCSFSFSENGAEKVPVTTVPID
jgi:hypothetical protein